ncbi:hypothetical protein [uncultured Fibrella sp.]|uniref:hypothetical protein n=1 Tax=uncultured Fibrella sp. TaxID=1284596 RepID=UPI0035C9AB79
MLPKIITAITKSPIYFGCLLLLLGFFAWSEFTGNRLIGDDKYETEQHGYGSGSTGRGYHRGRSSFYHK